MKQASDIDNRLQGYQVLATTSPRPWRAVLLVAVLAALGRLVYVQWFAVAMPFYDQWDAEGAMLLKPWIEGNFRFADLFHPHNEHRIFPTRIVTLALFLSTGVWSNLTEARFSAVLYALVPATLVWIALRDGTAYRRNWLLAPLALLFAILPFGWENFLVGFQSQWYFLILFSAAAVFLAATRHENVIAAAGVLVLSLLACLTVASGLLTPLVVACTYTLACVLLPGRRWPAVLNIFLLLALAAIAYTKVPVIPAHQGLRAHDVVDLVDAASHVLGWPIMRFHWAIFYLWVPGPVALAWLAARRSATRTDIIMAGLYGWSLAQGLAIAYGRGHGLIDLAPRYSELMVPGLFANAWFALRLWHSGAARRSFLWGGRGLALAFAVVLVGGLLIRTPLDWKWMEARSSATRIQEQNVLNYLRTKDPAALRVEFFELPYPVPARLHQLLDDPTIRRALSVPPEQGKLE